MTTSLSGRFIRVIRPFESRSTRFVNSGGASVVMTNEVGANRTVIAITILISLLSDVEIDRKRESRSELAGGVISTRVS